MKFILLFITTLACTFSFSQNLRYVDSLKRIIKRGIPEGEDNRTIKKQFRYINACEALGDYYHSLNQNKKAIYYYELVADLDGHILSDEQMELRDKVSLKVGDIYFAGRGIKKDLPSSIRYHSKALIGKSSSLKDHYSKLYFDNTDPIFILNARPFDTTTYAVNLLNIDKPLSKKLKEYLLPLINKLNSDTLLKCRITVGILPLGLTEENQGLVYRSLINIQDYLKKKIVVPNRIDAEVEIPGEICQYKSFKLPCLQITIGK